MSGIGFSVLAQQTNVSAATIIEIENVVEVQRAGAAVWDPARTEQALFPGDRVRTGEKSRAAIRLSSLTIVRLGELGIVQVPEDSAPKPAVKLKLFRGVFYFFHRDRADEFEVQTPTVAAVVRGTDFTVNVADDGRSTIALLDGEIRMTNSLGFVDLTTGEIAIAEVGQAPVRTAVLTGVNLVQWSLYYPAILDVEELPLSAAEREELAESLSAYSKGDVLAALAAYPTNPANVSASERVYGAALALAVGRDDDLQTSENAIGGIADDSVRERLQRLIAALRALRAAVAGQQLSPAQPELATEWMAQSYTAQARRDLRGALKAAKNATWKSPEFSFGWARLAELQFSFGENSAATESLERALQLGPRNAQALALDGFLLGARNKNAAALARLNEAITIDGALGNAWLGRGLVLIRTGDLKGGIQDLQVAATMEPQRALLRSYLGKAFSEAWDNDRARKEVELAKRLDPADPTGWLYSAIIHQQENEINAAVRDLEKSKALSENRSLYRTELLLDQDEAVQSANLASIYRDAGMYDVSLREAGRAVSLDYANHSVHLFLANSYDALRDPGLIDLRYETAHVSEYLTANLLAPPGAGLLSRAITQQEYSQFFERDRVRFGSLTEYQSAGSWLQESAVFGKFGSTGFSIESAYRSENGQSREADFEHTTWSAAVKQRLTAKDSLYLQAVVSDFEGGDLTPYYDPESGISGFRVHEEQEPLVLAGYHREWTLNSHTLFLASILSDDNRVNNPAQPMLLLGRNAQNDVIATAKPGPPTSALNYFSQTESYSAEVQQIYHAERHGFVVGMRAQTGEFDTYSQLSASSPTVIGTETTSSASAFATPALTQNSVTDFHRLTAYGYYTWQVLDRLALTAGLAYDHLRSPENFRIAPLSEAEVTEDQLSPKIGLIWSPARHTSVRGSYTRSLGGVSFEQSFRLEPTQVGGFNQAFRNLIPEAMVGTLSGAEFETAGIGIDHRSDFGLYLGLEAQWLGSEVDRSIGTFDLASSLPPTFSAGSIRQVLDYRERSLVAHVNQLLGEGFSFGARYALIDARLQSGFPEIPVQVSRAADSVDEVIFHQARIYGMFNHTSGFFASCEANWLLQDTRTGPPEFLDEEIWQFNAWVGWRFAERRAEAAVGILNITDQDYRFNPLLAMRELTRERTFSARLRLLF
jgi:Tfp pilus assembly protein PilF